MALVKYGAGIVQASGSISGQTHARNRSGNYIRARTTPVNPQSSRQSAVRARLAFLSEEWNATLTAAQRLAWDAFANAVSMLNRLGESINVTGFNMFIRGNLVLLQAGESYVAAGPVTMAHPPQDPLFAVALSAASGITVTFDDTFPWCDEDNAHMVLHIGNPQNASHTFFNGPWRYHASIAGNSITPPTSPDGPTAVTAWTLLQGQRCWVKGAIVRADGRVSNAFTAASVLVAA